MRVLSLVGRRAPTDDGRMITMAEPRKEDPSFSQSRAFFACFRGTFSLSRRQIRSTRLWLQAGAAASSSGSTLSSEQVPEDHSGDRKSPGKRQKQADRIEKWILRLRIWFESVFQTLSKRGLKQLEGWNEAIRGMER